MLFEDLAFREGILTVIISYTQLFFLSLLVLINVLLITKCQLLLYCKVFFYVLNRIIVVFY